MKIWSNSKHDMRVLVTALAVLGITVLLTQTGSAARRPPLFPSDFRQTNVQGFGDRQNSWSWSMQWWRGKLYVGTSRALECVEQAAWVLAYPDNPLFRYPPADPDIECTDSPQDLPLQAEIWRYTPETETWERVYQSPNDVEIPDHPGKFVARDIGFRGMAVFTEEDGTEALYISGINSYAINPGVPPPRILRSTDGAHFEPVPQDPGTLLGDLGNYQCCFREIVIYKGRLYVTNGSLQGGGTLLEAADPAGGSDNFRPVTPEGMSVMAYAPFNGYLYLGISDIHNGFTVAKTDASGTPPYDLTPVIRDGGFLRPGPSKQVLSMQEFQGRLYVGTDKPAEVYRINPDDTWELVVGTPRETPAGWKDPLSGMGRGFDYFLNGHMWRMQSHEGRLYVGTMDQSTTWKDIPYIGEILRPHMGFDLFATPDGWHFTMITRNGFESIFDYGIRTFTSTPYGLFFGTANDYYGSRVWQGVSKDVYTFFLPLLLASGTSSPVVPGLTAGGRGGTHSRYFLTAPVRLEVETRDGMVILSWESSRGAAQFHIFRSTYTANRRLQVPDFGPDVWIPGPFEEVGTSKSSHFIDVAAPDGDHYYHYYVIAEDAAGGFSSPSNLVRAPSLAPVVTFDRINDIITDWGGRDSTTVERAMAESRSGLEEVRALVEAGHLGDALRRVDELRHQVQQGQLIHLSPFRAEDLDTLLAKLARRIRLAQAGILSASDLNAD